MCHIWQASYARGVRLRNAGCRLPYLYALPGSGLRLYGDFGLMTAFNLSDGGSGFVLSVELRNLSVRRLWAADWLLEGPEGDFETNLLPDPRTGDPGPRRLEAWQIKRKGGAERERCLTRNTYAFNGFDELFERDGVINHLLGPRHPLFPRKRISGLVLVTAKEPLPAACSDGDRLELHLTVFDQRGGSDRVPFSVEVEKPKAKPINYAKRPRLDLSDLEPAKAPEASGESCVTETPELVSA
jgi:hypothetical protein